MGARYGCHDDIWGRVEGTTEGVAELRGDAPLPPTSAWGPK